MKRGATAVFWSLAVGVAAFVLLGMWGKASDAFAFLIPAAVSNRLYPGPLAWLPGAVPEFVATVVLFIAIGLVMRAVRLPVRRDLWLAPLVGLLFGTFILPLLELVTTGRFNLDYEYSPGMLMPAYELPIVFAAAAIGTYLLRRMLQSQPHGSLHGRAAGQA